jgi:hypothetical protein
MATRNDEMGSLLSECKRIELFAVFAIMLPRAMNANAGKDRQ